MCLNKVIKRIKNPSSKVVKCWKVFMPVYRDNARLEFVFGSGPTTRETWLQAESRGNEDFGFHFFYSKMGAENWRAGSQIVLPVLVRKVHTIGKHDSCYSEKQFRAGIAYELFIPKST
jgi:hypothetical protein